MDFPSDSGLTGMRSTVIGRGPISDIAITDSDGAVVVTNYGDSTVSVIDSDNQCVEATLAIDGEPVLAGAAKNRAFIVSSSASYDRVSVIDTATGVVVASHPIEYGVTAVAADPDSHRVFIGRSGRDRAQIGVIEGNDGDFAMFDIAVGSGLLVEALQVGAPGFVYAAVSDASTGCLYLIDVRSERVVAGGVLGAPIRDIAVAPDKKTVYVLTCDPQWGGAVMAIDAAFQKHLGLVPVEGFPTQMAISPDGLLYVLNGNSIDVIDAHSRQRVGEIETGTTLSSVAVDGAGVLHVADYSGLVSTFDTTSAVELPASA
jgi:DNA-binding beta-propeller fold protein YncE